MSHLMRRFTENVYLQMVKQPVALSDETIPATYIDVSAYERFAFLIAVGATDDTAVSMQVVQATSSAGAGSKSITGAAITTTVLAGTNDNKWAIVEVESRKLDIANDFRYVAVTVAATGGTSTLGTVLFIAWRGPTLPPTFGSDKAEIVYVDG